MRTWLDRPVTAALVAGCSAVLVVPTVLAVRTNGWHDVGALAFQLMLTLAGALLWAERDSRWNGFLLVAAGAGVGVSNLENSGLHLTSGYFAQVGWTFTHVVVAVLVQVLVSYPAARVEGRSRRLLVAAAWVWALAPRFVGSLLWSPAQEGWTGPPSRWVTLLPANDAAVAIADAQRWLLVVLVPWFVVVEVARWRTAHGAARVPTRIVAGAGIVLAVALLLRETAPFAVTAGWFDDDVGRWLTTSINTVGALAAAALVVVALRAATRRGAVVERLLAAGGDPRAVQDVLRTELVDPTLVLRFAVDGRWVDVDGEPVARTHADGRTARTLLEEDRRAVVEVDADEQVQADPAGLRVTLAAASVVLENTRLTLERSAHLAEVRASRARIVDAGVAQRRRLERDLHDGAQQHLLAVAATLSRAALTPEEDGVRAAVGDARAQLAAALAELRRLARGIHPAALSQGGLAAGLRALAAGVPGVRLHLGAEVDDGARFPTAVESTAYYVASEAVANAVKHAGADVVDVSVDVRADGAAGPALTVTVADRGRGGARVEPGGGLAGLQDRVSALGGSFAVEDGPAGGSVVRATLPVDVGGPG